MAKRGFSLQQVVEIAAPLPEAVRAEKARAKKENQLALPEIAVLVLGQQDAAVSCFTRASERASRGSFVAGKLLACLTLHAHLGEWSERPFE